MRNAGIVKLLLLRKLRRHCIPARNASNLSPVKLPPPSRNTDVIMEYSHGWDIVNPPYGINKFPVPVQTEFPVI